MHHAGGTASMVYDIWGSQGDLDALGATLLPWLAEAGVDVGEPMVMPIRNIVQP